MKRFMLTFVLAIAAGVWTLSNAMCLGSIPDAMYEPYTTVSGTIQALPFPCEPGEDCPPCLTEAIVTNDKTYYLTTKNQQVADFLEQIQTSPVPAIYLLPLKATASGTPYQMGSFDYLLISSLNELSVEYFSDQQENKLPSLCDEWNVWYESFQSFGPINYNAVIKYRLATDTMINGQRYVQLASDNSPYMEGALREGSNRDIYYIPLGSTHEYLLYAFNAQVGDTITNLYVGGGNRKEGYQAVVRAISDSNPRIFTVGVNIDEYTEYSIKWIEGVGSPETPCGLAVVPPSPADVGTYSLLCAYKNGEQVYVSEMGKQYGCEYNDDSHSTPIDTIPLFIKDGPGSSTVEPVDPNLIYATLTKDVLSVYAKEKTEISFVLYKAPKTNQVPATKRTMKSASFIGSLSTTLTESGTYTMELTNPAWGYTVFGTFEYKVPQAVENTPADTPSATKILKDGQLLFLYEGKMYNVQGQQVQ